jgi:DNA-binding response OmpR family regulator
MAPSTAEPTVLIADDDRDILELLAYRLGREGYEVLRASDGEEALRLAVERKPDLALLDVMMPKLDGFQVTRQIREHEATRLIPVILITARVREEDVVRGFEAGADDYMTKPFSPADLRVRMRIIMERRQRPAG